MHNQKKVNVIVKRQTTQFNQQFTGFNKQFGGGGTAPAKRSPRRVIKRKNIGQAIKNNKQLNNNINNSINKF
jgi:hypothetical protein